MSSEPAPSEPTSDIPARPERAIFKMPATAILAALFAMLCATPFAWSGPLFLTVYLLPIGFIVWVVRSRTSADVEGLTVRRVFGARFLPWSELKGLSITERSKVRAVLADDGIIALLFVRTRHLPLLALVSGGRIADPLGEPSTSGDDEDAEHEE